MQRETSYLDRPPTPWDFLLILAIAVGVVLMSLSLAGCTLPQAPPQAWGRYYGTTGFCTCVPIGKRLVATAKHCVEHLQGDAKEAVELFEQGEPRAVLATLMGEHNDAAVLYVDRDLDVWEPVRAHPQPYDYGFFLCAHKISHTCVVHASNSDAVFATCWPGAVAGDSGSPVVDEDGQVWGVVSASFGGFTVVSTVEGLYDDALAWSF